MSATPVASGVRWRQVRDDLHRRIDAEEFTDVFPGELALTEEYQVSRHTIREALRDLRNAGVITSERGRPSRVVPGTMIEQPAGTLYSLFESVASAGLTQRSDVIRLETCTHAPAAAQLQLDADASLVVLERIRYANDEPLAIDQVYLPAAIASPLLDADFSQTSLYDQLRTTCGIHLTGGEERIGAHVATTADQNHLGIDPAVALLVLDRIGCADGARIEYRQTRIRADRFSVIAHFAPGAYRFEHSDRPDFQHPGRTASAARVIASQPGVHA